MSSASILLSLYLVFTIISKSANRHFIKYFTLAQKALMIKTFIRFKMIKTHKSITYWERRIGVVQLTS